MTVLSSEGNKENTLNQENIDANASKQPVKQNITQEQETSINTPENNGSEIKEDPNWRAFREARKKDRAEREAAERRASEKEAEIAALKTAMEAAFSKSGPSPQAYQQYYGNTVYESEETEDQKIEKKVLALLQAKEEQSRREAQQREQAEYPNRIYKDFPDFNNVVSQENLDYLDFQYPEVSRPLQRLSEGYDKWSDIYHAIKKLIPNHSTAKKEAIRAEMNNQKPRSISSSSITQSGQSSMNTFQEMEQKRADNWQRMQRIMKGL